MNAKTPSKYQSPPPPLPPSSKGVPTTSNNISTSIMQHHGAESDAFLNHLQMTWDMHRNMEATSNSLRANNSTLQKEKEQLQLQMRTLVNSNTAAVTELEALRASNQSIKDEVSSMRKQLQRVVAAASNQRQLKDKANETLQIVEKENSRLNSEVAASKTELKMLNQKIVDLTHQLNSSVEKKEQMKANLEMSQKQQRALRVTEEEMATHLQRVVDRLQESEKNRSELKDRLAHEKTQQNAIRKECDEMKDILKRLRDTSKNSLSTITSLKNEIKHLKSEEANNLQRYEDDIKTLRKTLERKETSTTQVLERASLNHQKMEEECNQYAEKVRFLETEQINYKHIIQNLTNEMEKEGSVTEKKLTLATARISELKEKVDTQVQLIRELEECAADASKRQSLANSQMEKDGIKIRGLTAALGKLFILSLPVFLIHTNIFVHHYYFLRLPFF
jgi:chromosome segregation ATPase